VPLGLTLIEAQKYARCAEQLAVLKTFAEGELLRGLPFRNLVGGSLSFPAETKLPRVGFRAMNEGYRQSYGVINSDSEFVHLFGGDLDVDRSIVDLQGPEARAAQTEMKVRSMRLTLEAAIINGDDTFDPRAFNGLSKRLVPGNQRRSLKCYSDIFHPGAPYVHCPPVRLPSSDGFLFYHFNLVTGAQGMVCSKNLYKASFDQLNKVRSLLRHRKQA
jgi:hypothetical protein